jgi:hypothetical protein
VRRASLREYAAVQRLPYQQATRAAKHWLLNEIVGVTDLHCKARRCYTVYSDYGSTME